MQHSCRYSTGLKSGWGKTEPGVTGAMLVVALALIVAFYLWYKGEKETNASEALTSVSLPTGPDLARMLRMRI